MDTGPSGSTFRRAAPSVSEVDALLGTDGSRMKPSKRLPPSSAHINPIRAYDVVRRVETGRARQIPSARPRGRTSLRSAPTPGTASPAARSAGRRAACRVPVAMKAVIRTAGQHARARQDRRSGSASDFDVVRTVSASPGTPSEPHVHTGRDRTAAHVLIEERTIDHRGLHAFARNEHRTAVTGPEARRGREARESCAEEDRIRRKRLRREGRCSERARRSIVFLDEDNVVAALSQASRRHRSGRSATDDDHIPYVGTCQRRRLHSLVVYPGVRLKMYHASYLDRLRTSCLLWCAASLPRPTGTSTRQPSGTLA